MQDFITLANHLADESGKIIKQHFRTDFVIEQKEDNTAVTIADKGAEERLRQIIEEHRPDDGIIGEEFPDKESKNQYDWVLDPIDGTRSFVVGRPTFGTLIALCENGVPILGILNQPIYQERWIGVKGQPTLFNGKITKTVACKKLKQARTASTCPSQLREIWPKMYEQSRLIAWGSDCYAYGLVAIGGIDAVVETGLNTYDFAALPPIVEGAGGLMCDWHGNALNLNSDGTIIALGDPALKEQVLELVNS